MSRYILVHGAWEGSWTWEAVAPLLKQQGHEVTAVDLPGSYGNMRPVGDATMGRYISTVVDAIDGAPGEVILVGHSLAGAIVSGVAERVPEKIERLVYVAAFLLDNGENVLETMQGDEDGQLLPRLAFSEDQSYAEVTDETWRQVGFHDATGQAIERALPRLAARQATEPFLARVALTEPKFGSVPKTFIRTALDKIATPQLQDHMLTNWPVDRVQALQAGHFPALAMPDKLARALL